ncbi:hypothetical protein, variant 3 [Aphanomyces invadans]|uniref:Uncharacterized protein n=1 Tax=Aphanomyces invadans TaxID=157072 RepID=A0A024UUF9_9STRA|nr:hypothetical protein H310_00378 [Aphanomyces invadans]XP_008861370.1 hypothetical protein, variant 3 [Aphanomyces invadans]XP_008861371.1 hypothetical protein, variant 1 [Aphanomyces invadans]XP_008861372.1 hypothetical protein, variant 2 [Aphanomyces invadans]ETW09958.1 hypothetical protein H310_00378 [Aphanomyces invadans]ETW09959.1 hypothetical protein, variant 1 [Aphanomyces invadans]ETW09960.1 hypothetical protein, variant 2 [Aphanomyces invadans]ETW09961.1 hypothetical protein, vari|eukprot:XP_008861369.1 hypothetical protein H310_00378 [Aphanomyces invadans]
MQADAIDVQSTDLEVLSRLATQQRRNVLANLTQLRKHDYAYLRSLHADPHDSYFLNIARLHETSLNLSTALGPENHEKRCEQLYYLGLSLGRLLATACSSSQLIFDGCQLMDELDFYFSAPSIQNMKLVTVATKVPFYERPRTSSADDIAHAEPYRTVVRKWNNKPVYQRLVTPHIAFPLDYCLLVVSLCDVLTLVYAKLQGEPCNQTHVFQALLRLDEKLKKVVLDHIKKHLSEVATDMIKDQMQSLRPVPPGPRRA